MKKRVLAALLTLVLIVTSLASCSITDIASRFKTNSVTVTTGALASDTETQEAAQTVKSYEQAEVLEIASGKDLSSTYGSVTTEHTVIETKHLRLNIPPNVYIPDGLAEKLDYVTSLMENVSGLSFSGNSRFAADKISVEVIKMTDTESELGPAYASFGEATVSSGDLLDFNVIIHELSHSLKANNSMYQYCQWAEEGISTYTTYKLQRLIENSDADFTAYTNFGNSSLANYPIMDYDELFSQPLTYWMTNTLPTTINANYPIGFYLMHYLDEVYGNYTAWITEYEKANPANSMIDLSEKEQLKAFSLAYGENALDGFYPWLKENKQKFENYAVDLSSAEKFVFYPTCAADAIYYDFFYNFLGYSYDNLLIDIETGKNYLENYKGKSTAGMVLHTTEGVELALFDKDGNLLKIVRSEIANPDYEKFPKEIELDNVSYILLLGKGTFSEFYIEGFENTYIK